MQVRPCALLAIALALLGAAPVHAQEAREESWAEDRAARFDRCRPLDRGEIALALWSWRLAGGQAAREELVLAGRRLQDEPREVVDALLDPPPWPGVEGPTSVQGLVALLDRPASEGVLEEALRCARFSAGLDRQSSLETSLAELEAARPGHPWLIDARERMDAVRELLPGVETIFDTLALPVDPRTTSRVTLWTGRPARTIPGHTVDAPHALERAGAWVLESVDGTVRLLDDRLQERVITPAEARLRTGLESHGALPRLEPRDPADDLRSWRTPADFHAYESDPLSVRGVGALALRAWWALRRGQRWTAVCLLHDAAPDFLREEGPAVVLSQMAVELACGVSSSACVSLFLGRPRGPIAASLRRAAAALELPCLRDEDKERDLDRFANLELLTSFALGLEQQEAALRDATYPSWAEWQGLSPAERVPHLIRALPDCDGYQRPVWSGYACRTPWDASQRIPADAPPPEPEERPHDGGFAFTSDDEPAWQTHPSGRSAADGLLLAGEVAIPALIDVLQDRSPTRCLCAADDDVVDFISVGEAAERILDRIIDMPELRFASGGAREARQAAARRWWDEQAARGGLVHSHAAALLEVERTPDGWLGSHVGPHHVRWLVRHADLQRVRGLLSADAAGRTAWLDLLAEVPGDAHLRELQAGVDDPDPQVALAAAEALLQRGDARGAPRALALARAALDVPGEMAPWLSRALWVLARASAPELDDLMLRASATRPEADRALLTIADRLPRDRPSCLLALARLAARREAAPPTPDLPDPWQGAMYVLARRHHAGSREDRICATLAEALVVWRDPQALRHAAVSAALLGDDALSAISSRAGCDLRSALLDALAHEDAAHRAAAEDALHHLGARGLDRLSSAGAGPSQAALARARARVCANVVSVNIGQGLPRQLDAPLARWRDHPLDLARLTDLLSAWAPTGASALELEIERSAGDGFTVSATFPAQRVGAAVLVSVDGVWTRSEPALRLSDDTTRALAELQRALVEDPGLPVRIVVQVER